MFIKVSPTAGNSQFKEALCKTLITQTRRSELIANRTDHKTEIVRFAIHRKR